MKRKLIGIAAVSWLLGNISHPEIFRDLSLIKHIQEFPSRFELGDPGTPAASGIEGPKAIAEADFDGDGIVDDLAVSNLDGTVTVLLGLGGGDFETYHLATGMTSLRGIIAADLNGDGKTNIATAAPFDGKVMVFYNNGDAQFSAATELPEAGWKGVRDLASRDFDGDGVLDLVVAGLGRGVRHLKGKGGGAFEVLGDLRRLSPAADEFPKPVFSMRAIPALDGSGRDDLAVIHADSDKIWILSTVPVTASASTGVIADSEQQQLPENTGDTPLVITEFLTRNTRTLKDENGEYSDWIEVFNRSDEPVNLEDWYLSDNLTAEWQFPRRFLQPGEFVVVFASNKNRAPRNGELHANFRLSSNDDPDKETLALVYKTGKVRHRFPAEDADKNESLVYPEQIADISYGLSRNGREQYFQLPSPGRPNNSGVDSLSDLTLTEVSDYSAQVGVNRARVSVRLTDVSHINTVWFGAATTRGDRYWQMQPGSEDGAGDVFVARIPTEDFDPEAPVQVIVRRRDQRIRSVAFASEAETAPPEGILRAVATIPAKSARSMAVGRLFSPANAVEGPLDLVTANRNEGSIEIRKGNRLLHRFDHFPAAEFQISGSPRSVRIADIDNDGWNDLVVALRDANKAVVLRSSDVNGTRGFEAPEGFGNQVETGGSPRDIAILDANQDGQLDAAIINRVTNDLSVLLTNPDEIAFNKLDQIYRTDGQASSLQIYDFNGDSLQDVVITHRATGEVSVRLASNEPGKKGSLGPPTFYAAGTEPNDVDFDDYDFDGINDMVVADLNGLGTINIRLGRSDESFGPLTPYNSASLNVAGLLSVASHDFDDDDYTDIVATFFDCRVTFFRGLKGGSFRATAIHGFVDEPRDIIPIDPDGDGDMDVASVSFQGNVVVLENIDGRIMDYSEEEFQSVARHDFVLDGGNGIDARDVRKTDLNNDGFEDLIVGTGSGLKVLFGADKMRLREASITGADFPASAVAVANFDGEEVDDVVVGCRERRCISFFKMEGGALRHQITVDVPGVEFLASGDLDGDGRPDLVGMDGDVLWTALSTRKPRPSDVVEALKRDPLRKVVINEILAKNTRIPLTIDRDKQADYLELFNGSEESVDIGGWEIELEEPGKADKVFQIPARIRLQPGDHLMIICSPDSDRSPFHTGFRLPGGGATVRLTSGNTVIDEVDLETLSPGQPLRFSAEASDDVGIVSVWVNYLRLDVPGAKIERLILFDDGNHGDGDRLDGVYSNVLRQRLPAGAAIEFYLEAQDLTGKRITFPDDAELALDGESVDVLSLGIDDGLLLRITEVVSDNAEARPESSGSDYVEIQNIGQLPIGLDGLMLSTDFASEPEKTFHFPAEYTLAPGETVLVHADNEPTSGVFHAPFGISNEDEQLVLMGTGPGRARTLVDFVDVPALETDHAYSRAGDIWRRGNPSPQAQNPLEAWEGFAFDEFGEQVFARVFPFVDGFRYRAEASDDLNHWQETTVSDPFAGFASVAVPISSDATSYLRIRPVAPVPAQIDVQIDGVNRESAQMRIAVVDPGGAPPELTVFYDNADRGAQAIGWENAVAAGKSIGESTVLMAGLESDTEFVCPVRADNGAVTWSEPLVFKTLPAGVPLPEAIAISGLNTIFARLSAAIDEPANADLFVYWGLEDGGTTPAAWQHVLNAGRGESIDLVLNNLQPGTDYYARALAVTAGGDSIWSPSSTAFTTQSMFDALQQYLLVSEFMYHPPSISKAEQLKGRKSNDFEWIEFYNAGPAPLDLREVSVQVGIDFDFGIDADIQELAPGGFIVIMSNRPAFTSRYNEEEFQIAGQWCGPFNCKTLANDGIRGAGESDSIVIAFRESQIIQEIPYRDKAPWPTKADGKGFSVELRKFAIDQDLGDPANWQVSEVPGGTPGRASPVDPKIDDVVEALKKYLVVSEISPFGGSTEYLEFWNVGPDPLNVSDVLVDDGIRFDFSSAAIREIPPDSYLLIVRDTQSIAQRYGAGIAIAGEYVKKLGANDDIVISAKDVILHRFRYSTKGYPWPISETSLVLKCPEANPDHSNPFCWTASRGRSPGAKRSGETYETWIRNQGDGNRSSWLDYVFPEEPRFYFDFQSSAEGKVPDVFLSNMDWFGSRPDADYRIEVSGNLKSWKSVPIEVDSKANAIIKRSQLEALLNGMPTDNGIYFRSAAEAREVTPPTANRFDIRTTADFNLYGSNSPPLAALSMKQHFDDTPLLRSRSRARGERACPGEASLMMEPRT